MSESCYCCGLPITSGRVCVLRDADDLEFMAHADCVEKTMYLVATPPPLKEPT